MTDRKIMIFDTTLRDGEQAPGCTLTPEQKIIITGQLVRLGVDVIEPGFPVSSPGEFAAVQQISRMYPQVEIVGFARAMKGDIDAAVKATQDAASRRLHLFISSSDIHLDFQLRKNRAEVIHIAREMVAYAKQFVERIEFSAMDASRSGTDFLIELVETVIEEGATIINLPDTVGYAMPEDYGNLFRQIRAEARGADRVEFSAHCHNDLGMAVANSIAAIQAGASQVEVTVNGVGERTGNCALEELVMVLETHKHKLGVQTGIQLGEIYETSRLISRSMHFPIAFNKPVVGRNAFQHESGIHQDGLLKNRNTYEIMEPEKLGISRSMIVLGKHSGRHAIKHRAEHYGIVLNEQEVESVYNNFKQVADEHKIVTDYQLLEIIGSSRNTVVETYSLIDLQVTAGTRDEYASTATIFDNRQGVELFCSSVGEGPLGAAISSIKQAVAADVEFEDLELHSLSSGESAHGEAVVTINRNGNSYRGSAMHKDIVLAAAQAFLAACNQAVRE
ncbi:MAG: 2-isopropylmalate synthase [Paenibacillaceae bacterium]